MKSLIALPIAFCLVTAAHAAAPCAKLEFAELDSMPKEQLLQMRCEYVVRGYKLGSNSCSEETIRMDRIIVRKYDLKGDGSEFPHLRAIDNMCAPYLK
jgi:hypothetical protein